MVPQKEKDREDRPEKGKDREHRDPSWFQKRKDRDPVPKKGRIGTLGIPRRGVSMGRCMFYVIHSLWLSRVPASDE